MTFRHMQREACIYSTGRLPSKCQISSLIDTGTGRGALKQRGPALEVLKHFCGHLACTRRGAEARQSRDTADSTRLRSVPILLLPP